jgi:hypothetical protein
MVISTQFGHRHLIFPTRGQKGREHQPHPRSGGGSGALGGISGGESLKKIKNVLAIQSSGACVSGGGQGGFFVGRKRS